MEVAILTPRPMYVPATRNLITSILKKMSGGPYLELWICLIDVKDESTARIAHRVPEVALLSLPSDDLMEFNRIMPMRCMSTSVLQAGATG